MTDAGGKAEGLQGGAALLWDAAACFTHTPLHTPPWRLRERAQWAASSPPSAVHGPGNETRPRTPRPPRGRFHTEGFACSGPSMMSMKWKGRPLPIWPIHVERRL